ncbi:MAG TPA: hypothetical protein H9796_07575 [Candidatus Butyricimonas faecavium]|nr:hypothetical protein [Candidatus Butyricimonas faecavium]
MRQFYLDLGYVVRYICYRVRYVWVIGELGLGLVYMSESGIMGITIYV